VVVFLIINTQSLTCLTAREKEMKIEICAKCKGSGSVYPKYAFDQRDSAALKTKCKNCNGTGQIK
jgi:DnaJ-class molecular chaperone